MTVPVQDPVTAHTGNGVTTNFSYDFLLLDEADLLVYVDNVLKSLATDYTLTGIGNPAGGEVVFATAPATSAAVLFQRSVVLERQTDYQYAGDFQSDTVNRDFDRLMMAHQDTRVLAGRTIRLPPSETSTGPLPSVAARALKALGFDAAGNPVAIAGAGDASQLALLLQDDSESANGSGLVGFDPSLSYPADTIGARLSGLADVADSTKGAALAGYKAAYTGAVGRTLAARLGDVVSVKDFGAKGDGATNDAAAFQAAIDYCEAQGGGTVFVPRGRYMIGSALAMKRKVGVEGAGIDATILQPTFSGVLFSIDLTYLTPVAGFPDASVYWRKLTIDCVAQTGVTGIKMVQCRFSEISEIKFRGCVENIHIDRGRKHSIHTIYSEGTATLKVGSITLTSTNTSDYVFETHVRDVHFHNNYTTGTQPVLLYIRRGALVLVSDVTLNDGWQGNATAAVGIILENDCQGCKVSNVVLAAVSDGVRLQVGSGPSIAPSYCNLFNVDIDQARSSAVNMAGAAYCTFVGCKFSSSGVMPTITAVVVSGGAGNNQFLGCHVDNYNGVGGTAFDFTGVTGNRVQDCIISNCTNGIQIGASTTTQAVIGCLFASVTNRITGTPGQTGNVIKNNSGHRLTTNLSPAMAASAAVTTNNTGYACTVHITGGTVTIISVNGIFTGLTSGTVRLEPGDTIAITYSAAPNWIWVPSWG